MPLEGRQVYRLYRSYIIFDITLDRKAMAAKMRTAIRDDILSLLPDGQLKENLFVVLSNLCQDIHTTIDVIDQEVSHRLRNKGIEGFIDSSSIVLSPGMDHDEEKSIPSSLHDYESYMDWKHHYQEYDDDDDLYEDLHESRHEDEVRDHSSQVRTSVRPSPLAPAKISSYTVPIMS